MLRLIAMPGALFHATQLVEWDVHAHYYYEQLELEVQEKREMLTNEGYYNHHVFSL